MNKSLISSFVGAVVVVIIVAAGYLYIQKREDAYRHDLSKLLELKEELAVTKNNLLGYTKFTDYIVATKSASATKGKKAEAKQDKFHCTM